MTHTETFIRAVIDEAWNRTPPGGFPAVEERHGLAPGTISDWMDRFGPARPPAPFSALHFWIGTVQGDEAAFAEYFDHDPAYWSVDEDTITEGATDVTGCGFSIDLGERHLYDEDLLQVMWQPTAVPVHAIVAEATLASPVSAGRVVDACTRLGIVTATAGFAYADPTQVIREPGKLFNGLAYIGLFDNPRSRETP